MGICLLLVFKNKNEWLYFCNETSSRGKSFKKRHPWICNTLNLRNTTNKILHGKTRYSYCSSAHLSKVGGKITVTYMHWGVGRCLRGRIWTNSRTPLSLGRFRLGICVFFRLRKSRCHSNQLRQLLISYVILIDIFIVFFDNAFELLLKKTTEWIYRLLLKPFQAILGDQSQSKYRLLNRLVTIVEINPHYSSFQPLLQSGNSLAAVSWTFFYAFKFYFCLQTTFFTQKYYLVLTTSLKARLKVSIICSNSMERLEGRSKMLEKFYILLFFPTG